MKGSDPCVAERLITTSRVAIRGHPAASICLGRKRRPDQGARGSPPGRAQLTGTLVTVCTIAREQFAGPGTDGFIRYGVKASSRRTGGVSASAGTGALRGATM